MAVIEEKNLALMEALLKHSTMGVHILFDNSSIANVMKEFQDDTDFTNFEKMKVVQDVMTTLIAKKSFVEKQAYLQELDKESYALLVRTYFHIVENTVRDFSEIRH